MCQFRNLHIISQLIVVKNQFFEFLKTVEAFKRSKKATKILVDLLTAWEGWTGKQLVQGDWSQ